MRFQSTRPVRGGTLGNDNRGQRCRFQSTRPVRGGTVMSISWAANCRIFQSTRPVRGGTSWEHAAAWMQFRFQSTRPVRGGTYNNRFWVVPLTNFNPPALCGAGRWRFDSVSRTQIISIHPPCAGRD